MNEYLFSFKICKNYKVYRSLDILKGFGDWSCFLFGFFIDLFNI